MDENTANDNFLPFIGNNIYFTEGVAQELPEVDEEPDVVQDFEINKVPVDIPLSVLKNDCYLPQVIEVPDVNQVQGNSHSTFGSYYQPSLIESYYQPSLPLEVPDVEQTQDILNLAAVNEEPDVRQTLHEGNSRDNNHNQDYFNNNGSHDSMLQGSNIITENSNEPGRCEWDEFSVKKLLLYLKGHKEWVKKLARTRSSRIKKILWERASVMLHRYNYNYSPKQVGTKWKNLKKNYKDDLKNGKISVRYKSEIEEILG